jgi:cobalt-zinc-cadmium efflux system outer membrane protein
MFFRPKYAVLALLTVSIAQSQQTLSLRGAVSRAMETHPLLAAGAARIAAGEGLVLQAGLRPNPVLTLQAENLRPYGGQNFQPSREIDAFAFLTRPWEMGGKRRRRVEFANANLRRAQLERELLGKQIAGRVRQSYWNAAGAQKIHELLLETAANFQSIIQYHQIRVREGAMAEADLLKVRIEGERIAVAVNAAALEAERASIQLLREMGQVTFPRLRLSEDMDAPLVQPLADVERALERRTEVQLARQSREAALSNVRLQEANASPDLGLTAGYKRTSGFSSIMAGVQIPLRFSDRNQGNIAAAQAEVRMAESELAAASALVRAEVRAAQADVDARRRQLTDVLQGVVERAAESSQIAQAAYREGGADLLGLLDAERVRIDLQTLYYRTLAEYRQSVAALETAMGVEP